MDANSWAARLFSASKRYQSALHSRSEFLSGFEDMDMADEVQDEYPCPFCSEYFDVVGLCCHIDDEHPVEANYGVCPVCAVRVGVDMVSHITFKHGNIFKVQRNRKSQKNGAISLFKREMREANFRSLFGGSSRAVSSSSAAPDPLLSSFILPMADECEGTPSISAVDVAKKSSTLLTSERKMEKPAMSMKDKEEKAKRCSFIHELLLSAVLNDDNL